MKFSGLTANGVDLVAYMPIVKQRNVTLRDTSAYGRRVYSGKHLMRWCWWIEFVHPIKLT